MPFKSLRSIGLWLLLSCLVLLAGCNFRLRGTDHLPFETIYLNFAPHSEMGATLRRKIEATSSTKVVENRKQAQVEFVVLENRDFRENLSLDALGRVRDINLFYRFSFQLINQKGEIILPPTTFTVRREMTNNDAQLIAKEFESQTLFNEMQTEIIERVIRRLHSMSATPLKQ